MFNSYSLDRVVFVKQNSRPKYFAKEENKLGLCGEIYQAIANGLKSQTKVKVEIKDTLFPIKRILSMLEEGSADVYCGAGRNAKRERLYIYSKQPVYYVSNVVAAHRLEKEIPNNYNDLMNKKYVVGAYHGTSSASFLKGHRDIRVNDQFTKFDRAFKLIHEKKLKYFYYHDLGLNHLIKMHNYDIRVLPTKFRTVPQWIIYSKKTPVKVRTLIEKEIERVYKNKEIHKIWAKFF